jgi:hypothetical protein
LLIAPYQAAQAAAVEAFNGRLNAGGSPFVFTVPEVLGPHPDHLLTRECYLATENSGEVRGAYIVIHQPFRVAGAERTLPFLQLPLSEGSVDPRYAAAGLMLLKDALRRNPLLFGLGMGSIDRPLPRMFRLLGARVREVPFFFRVLRPFAFLRGMPLLRSTPARRMAADVAAYSGAGALAIRSLNAARRLAAIPRKRLGWELCERFPAWADEIWEAAKPGYSMIAVRDRASLDYLFHPARTLKRIAVFEGSRPVGWALLIDDTVRGHRWFGNMRVGIVADCLALPGHEDAVVAAADYALRDAGADVSVSNQMAAPWRKALVRAGYLRHTSGFILAVSKNLSATLGECDRDFEGIHVNRGDGDRAYSL